jgi:cation:H+ antiporter
LILAIALLVVGAAVLAVGAESAIRGAGSVAQRHGLSPFTLGALLFGIDIESLGAALIAAGRGQTSIAAGEALGAIVFLIAVAFGSALLVAREPVPSPSRAMVLLPALALVVGSAALANEKITRLEGLALVLAYAAYVAIVIQEPMAAVARGKEIQREAAETRAFPPVLLALFGLGLVYLGATILVEGGVRLLSRTGLAQGFVGAAIIGGLASLDEVFLEVLPLRRGMFELATGNLFGSIAAFSTGILGLAALVRPLTVDSTVSSAFLAASVLYTVVAVAFLSRGRAGKLTGVAVLLVYGLWLALASRL